MMDTQSNLMRVLDFSFDELQLNQHGMLSERQQKVLASLPRLALYAGVGVAVMCIYPTWFLTMLTVPLFVLGGMMLFFGMLVYLRLRVALRTPVIREARGALRLKQWLGIHWLLVGNQRFRIGAEAYHQLSEGGVIHLYYIELGVAKHRLSVNWTEE